MTGGGFIVYGIFGMALLLIIWDRLRGKQNN